LPLSVSTARSRVKAARHARPKGLALTRRARRYPDRANGGSFPPTVPLLIWLCREPPRAVRAWGQTGGGAHRARERRPERAAAARMRPAGRAGVPTPPLRESAWIDDCGDGFAVAALTGFASGAGEAGAARRRAGAPDI